MVEYCDTTQPAFPMWFVTNEQDFDSMKLMEIIQAIFAVLNLENLLGESKKDVLRINFDRKLKLEFHESESHQ